MQRAGSALSPVLKELGMESAIALHRLRGQWGSLFGEALSLHARPVSLSGGRLLINVDSPVWLQELSFLKADMAEKLKGFGVKDIRLRLGRIRREG